MAEAIDSVVVAIPSNWFSSSHQIANAFLIGIVCLLLCFLGSLIRESLHQTKGSEKKDRELIPLLPPLSALKAYSVRFRAHFWQGVLLFSQDPQNPHLLFKLETYPFSKKYCLKSRNCAKTNTKQSSSRDRTRNCCCRVVVNLTPQTSPTHFVKRKSGETIK